MTGPELYVEFMKLANAKARMALELRQRFGRFDVSAATLTGDAHRARAMASGYLRRG